MTRYLASPKVIAGLLSLALGLLLAASYDPADYETRDHRRIGDPAEAGRVMAENMRKEQARDQHVLLAACCVGFGLLILLSGIWSVRRKARRTRLEALGDAAQASKLALLADALEDAELDD